MIGRQGTLGGRSGDGARLAGPGGICDSALTNRACLLTECLPEKITAGGSSSTPPQSVSDRPTPKFASADELSLRPGVSAQPRAGHFIGTGEVEGGGGPEEEEVEEEEEEEAALAARRNLPNVTSGKIIAASARKKNAKDSFERTTIRRHYEK